MTAIKAQITKDKESKQTIYSFQANGETFTAYFANLTLQIQHNETTLGTILWEIDKNRKFQYTVKTNADPITITAWIDVFSGNGNSRANKIRIGIEVNGEPVLNTLADQQLIQKGKLQNRSNFLCAIVFLIIIFGPFHQSFKYIFKEYLSITYIIPFFLATIPTIKTKSITIFAILSNTYLLALEILYILKTGTFSNTFIIIWFSIRTALLCGLCYIYKQEREQKKASNA